MTLLIYYLIIIVVLRSPISFCNIYYFRCLVILLKIYILEQLWRAPELIDSNCRGTQKGDIFSFAIICTEILTREDPYAMYEMGVDG